jgi:hypothetical protein
MTGAGRIITWRARAISEALANKSELNLSAHQPETMNKINGLGLILRQRLEL